jgi:hypothetical protein
MTDLEAHLTTQNTYSTVGGIATRGEAFSKLMWHLSEAANQAFVISHLHNTEASKMEELNATGWRGVGEMLLLTRDKITLLAKRNFQ